MQQTTECRAVRWTIRVGRAGAILAAVALLAGCLGTSTGGTGTSGGVGITRDVGTAGGSSSTGGNGYGGNGGNGTAGGNGGDGYGGNGGNGTAGDGYGGNGGSGTPGADGAPGGSYSGPDAVTGSGRLTSRTIDVSGVTSVVAGANFVVHLTMGSPAQATVRMDDNLTDRIEATVTGHELRLGIKPGMSVRNATLSADVTVGQLDRLAANGVSKVTLRSPVTGPALQLLVNGASQIIGPVGIDHLEASESGASVLELSGHARSLHLSVEGTSQLLGPELAVADLDAVLSGASQATVTVSDTLAATADGVSVLRYRGSPRITRQQTSGVSSITPDSP